MNDDELDRLVANAAPVRDSRVAALDLRDAEDDLLEEIMATTTTRVSLRGGPSPDGDGPQRARHRLRSALAIGTVAAATIAVFVVITRDDKDVVTETPSKQPTTTLPTTVTVTPGISTEPLVALPIPDEYELVSAGEDTTDAGGQTYTVEYRLKEIDLDRNFSGFVITTTVDPDGSVWESLGGAGEDDGLEVRGHDAVWEGAAGTIYVNWQESDGVVVTVSSSSDKDEGVFESFVEPLHAATPAEWQSILQEAGD
jgi:hypothetical protein